MTEFKAIIVAELDTAELEKRLSKVLGKNYKLTIESEKAKEDINSIGNSITQTEKKTFSFGSTLKNALHIGSAAVLVSKGIGLIRTAANKAVESVKNLNQSLTDLRIVTNKSNAEATKIMDSYNSMGQMLGATTSEIADSGIAWLRQGKSISEANNLIAESTKLSKIGMLDNADATKYLTSTLNGYRLESEQASSVVDKLSKLDSAAAITAGGLAEGMSQTASTANDLGISMDRLIGYLSIIGSVTQGSMSSIGQALKTIFSRMSNVKLGKVEFTDDSGTTESLSDVETTLAKLGIKLRESDNQFRDFGSVLDEVGSKWDNYSSVQQAAITKAFAGVRQGENFRVLMNNYEQAIKYMNLSADSAGAAEEKYSAYTDSIEAKSKTLQAAFEGLATNSISDDTVKNIISATTAMVKFVDETNLLKGVVTGGFAVGLIKGFTLLRTGISAASMKLNQFSAALKLVKSGNLGQAEIQQLANLTANLSQHQLKAVLSSKALSAEQRIAVLTAQGLSRSEAEAALSSMGLAAAEGTAAGATRTLSGTLKGLWATIKANPIGVIFTAISAAVMVFQAYNDSVKQMQENAVNALNETNEHIKNVESSLKAYYELDSSATDKEKTDALKAVIEQLDNKTTALKNATEAEEGYAKAVKDSAIADYEEAARTAKDSRITAQDALNDNNWSWNSKGKQREIFGGNDDIYNDYIKPLLEASDKIFTRIVPATQAVEISYKSISGNAEEQARGYLEYYNALLEVQTQLRKKAEELGKDGDKILESESYKGLSAILNDETFKPAVDNFLNSYATEIYSRAIAENGIPETIADFTKLKSVMLEQAGDCTLLANAVTDKLNSAYGNLADTAAETATEIENTNFTIDTETFKNQVKELADEINSITKAYESLNGIIEDYNTNGNFTIGNLETLAELGDDYVNCLFNENGQLQLNKDSFVKLAKAKIEDIRYSMLENAISQINALSKEDEAAAADDLAESTTTLTEKTLMLAAAQKLAEGVPEEKIRTIIDTYSRWNAVIDNVIDGLDNNTDATFNLKQASDKLKDSLNAEKDSLEQSKKALESQKKALEATKNGYENAVDSIKSLIDWTKKYITQTKDDEIKALEDKRNAVDDNIAKQKELLQAERDRAKAEREIADKQNAVTSSALAAAVASLDDSAAGRKSKKQADEKLSESRKDLSDYLSDYEYEQRIDELDKLKEENEKYYNNQIDSIKSFLDDEVALFKAACNMIDTDSGELYGNLFRYSQQYTTTTEAEFNHMWTSAQSAMQQYNSANIGTFELMNNLQDRIYEVDTTIDTVADGISAYESRIQGVQDKLTNLSNAAVTAMNDIAAAMQTEDKWKEVQAYKPKWYYRWQGTKYNSIEENRDGAIADILHQISAKYGGVYPASASTIYGTIKHYATGTKYAKGGVSEIDESGNLETLMKKTPGGNYVIMDKGDQVFTKDQTDRLHQLSDMTEEELFGDYLQTQRMLKQFDISSQSPYTALLSSMSDSESAPTTNNFENIKNAINNNVEIHNHFEGSVDRETLRMLERKEDEIIEKANDKLMNKVLSYKRALIRMDL